LNNQRFAESLEQIQMVTRSQAGFADAWLFQGSLELQNNQFKEAETSLLRFLQLTASAPEAEQSASGETDERTRGLVSAYLALAQIAEQRKDFAGSEAWLAKIGSPEDVVRVQSRRASSLAKQGKLDEARQLLQNLPARSEADARFKLAAELQLLRDYRKYAQAYELLNQALKKSPNDVEWLYEQAMLAEKMGNIGVMERLLRQVIAVKPDYHHAYNALGYSFADRNVRLAEAKQLITKALEFAPADPFITDSLAWAEFRLGNKEEALRLLQWAFKNRPDAEIAAHLGEVLWSLNRKDEALSIWREGKGLNADNDTLMDTLKRLGVNP
jgi:tetratricopeptide (TPR) repeat protein